ncbi:MAG: polysaccharide pyruvyl transferase family protein [Salinivirgaceae bacterium]|nr:polysaccharide pyruvyl transferase family protein [Salinivirgaceae bacterium]
MKIGLLTYHHSSNIGAMMQTYATCRALKEMGHEVVIVDIRQEEDHRQGLGGLASNMIFFVRNQKYKAFKNTFYPPLTRRYYSVDELRNSPPKVDCFMVGSDQTWNLDISKEIAMAYFLDFGEKTMRRISYASSFGKDYWNSSSSLTEEVNHALHRFNSISVRERTGVQICKDAFGLKAELVVDPTILFDSYPEIISDIPEMKETVCYKLNRTPDFYKRIIDLKQTMGCPIRMLNNAYPVKGMKYTYPPSVEEWIRRIGGARFVVTDSFHGVVFSLLYQRQFVAIKNNNGRDSRYVDILTELGLENRLFESVEDMIKSHPWDNIINYKEVNFKMEQLRQESWKYLAQALE